jgi:hypothetical protein
MRSTKDPIPELRKHLDASLGNLRVLWRELQSLGSRSEMALEVGDLEFSYVAEVADCCAQRLEDVLQDTAERLHATPAEMEAWRQRLAADERADWSIEPWPVPSGRPPWFLRAPETGCEETLLAAPSSLAGETPAASGVAPLAARDGAGPSGVAESAA